MKFIRIIPKLEIKNNNLIKGINLEGLRVLGDPYEFAQYYSKEGLADELYYLDNVATLYDTNTLTKYIKKTANNLFIPLSVGGGIRNIDDISRVLNAGADKVSVNSKLFEDISFLKKITKIYGSSTITVTIEYIKIKNKYFVTNSNGRNLVNINPIQWAKKVAKFGAGEIFLTCINKEGLGEGYDIQIIKEICKSISIPVIAHGGAGNFKHVLELIKKTNVSGISMSSMLHYDVAASLNYKKQKIGNFFYLDDLKKKNKKPKNNLKKLKLFLKQNNVNVRL